MKFLRLLVGCLAAASILVAQGAGPVPVPDARVPKVYDCSKLLAEVVAKSKLPNAGPDAATQPPGFTAALSRSSLARLASAARFLIRPELRDGEELQVLGERWLVLLGRPEQHAWMDRLVIADLESALPVGRLKVQMVTLPEEVFDDEVVPILGGEGGAGDVAVLEPGNETEAFVAAVLDHEDGWKVDVDAVELRRMWPTTATRVKQTAYVKDFEVENANGAVIANPIIDVVEDGLTVQVIATSVESGTMGLSITASLADLVQPIPTFTTTLAGSTLPVTIQLPKVTEAKVETAVELKSGQIVAMALPAALGKRSLVLVRVEPLEEARGQERR